MPIRRTSEERKPAFAAALFAVLLMLLAPPVAAGEGGAPAGEGQEYSDARIGILRNRIDDLRQRHDQLLIQGKADDQLKSTIRQLLEARRAGDWATVETLLNAYDRPVVEIDEEAAGDGEESSGRDEQAVEERKVSYRSGDLLLTAHVFVPGALGKEPPYPGVLMVHNSFLGTGLSERRIAGDLARKYYLVMIAEPRGYGRNPGSPEYAMGEVDDVIAAFKALQALEECDQQRKPALLGDRHGANCVLLAAARLGEEVALTIAVNPYPDFADALKKPSVRSLVAKLRLRLNRHDTRVTVPRSPFFNVSGIDCPVRIFYGKENRAVEEQCIDRYTAVLQARKVDVRVEQFYTAGEELFDNPHLLKTELARALQEVYRPQKKRRSRRR